MRNFDKYSRLADSSVREGLQDPASVSNANLVQVVSDLSIVASCVDTVLNSEGLDLFPSKAKRLSGQEQQDFIAKYFDYMSRFKTEVVLYSNEFAVLSSQAAEQRNFSQAQLRKKLFGDIVNEAHEHL